MADVLIVAATAGAAAKVGAVGANAIKGNAGGAATFAATSTLAGATVVGESLTTDNLVAEDDAVLAGTAVTTAVAIGLAGGGGLNR